MERSMTQDITTRYILWAVTSLLSILPIIGSIIFLRFFTGKNLDLSDIFGDGQLCLFSTMLSISSLFKYLGLIPEIAPTKGVIYYTIATFVIVYFSLFAYVHVTSLMISNASEMLVKSRVSLFSFSLAICSILLSYCINFVIL
jgi:hypothetical protein